MTIVKFLNGDLKEYKSCDHDELITLISDDIQIDTSLIHLTKNEDDSCLVNYFAVILESKDYPFTCWENYFACFVLSCQGDNHLCLPKYREVMSQKTDISIMMEMLNDNHDPQQGLTGLVQACVDGCRYSVEMIPHFDPVIKNMIKKGATINEEIVKQLLTPLYSDMKYFEDDMGKLITAKGLLLKLFLPYDGVRDLLLSLVPDWDEFRGTYWEDLMGSNYAYRDAYLRALKNEMYFREYENEE
jgi:hypothetical protein